MGAPIGNQNAKRQRIWHAAILRALDARDKSRIDGKKELDALAEKLLDLVATGDLAALKEFGDRLDGKPAQAIVGDEDSPPVQVTGFIKLVGLDEKDDSP
jgi:hypothetical protein